MTEQRRCRKGHADLFLRGNGWEWRCRTCQADNKRAFRARQAAGVEGKPTPAAAPPPPPPDDVEILEERDPLGDTQETEPVVVDEGAESPRSGEPGGAVYNAAPAVHTSRTKGESYLVIPDTQDPYSAPGWLPWAQSVAREHGVEIGTPGRVLHTGDEADQYWASRFDKDPDHHHTASGELAEYKRRVQEQAAAFPHMWFPRSNHGDRWKKRALFAQLPSQLMRAWREVIEAPPGWRWETHFRIRGSREEFILEHGDQGAQGLNGTRQRVLDNGVSTVHGHQHATACVVWVATMGRPRPQWGFNAACLIDVPARAFDYGRGARFQPTVGIGVILDGGRVPKWIPYEGSS